MPEEPNAVSCDNCGLAYRVEVVERPDPAAVTGKQYCPTCGEITVGPGT